MLVSTHEVSAVASLLSEAGTYALDTETTGLRPFHGDRLFSLIISNKEHSFYFNFHTYGGTIDSRLALDKKETLEALGGFFGNAANLIYMHNAKFDLAMLAAEGVEVAGKVYDTMVLGRLLYNCHQKYSLDSLCSLIGLEKSSAVEQYIAKHRLWSWQKSPGNDKRSKNKHYDKVPFEIMAPYGEQDGRVTLQLGEYQRREIDALSTATGRGGEYTLNSMVELEAGITKACLAMERTGALIDLDYCKDAYSHEVKQADKAAGLFEEISGIPFKDSRKTLAQAFDQAGEKYPLTEKGNPSFKDDVLAKFTSPLARLVQKHREHTKFANTYFSNFIYFADEGGRIHTNMLQSGTETGRFSYKDPNLQNCPKQDEETPLFPIRRAFVPTPGYFYVMIDYDQVEYRVMLDYAGEEPIIRKIMDGMDVHTATAEQMSVTRKEAKTLNFLLIYGGGSGALADALGVPLREAEALKANYFESLPNVSAFINNVKQRANSRGFIFNAYGRVSWFPYRNNPRTGRQDRMSYKAPNHLIQGCCADVMKTAMVRVDEYLRDKRSRMLLSIHDELVLEVHNNEPEVVAVVKGLMENSYHYRKLPLTCGVDHSRISWYDKNPWK